MLLGRNNPLNGSLALEHVFNLKLIKSCKRFYFKHIQGPMTHKRVFLRNDDYEPILTFVRYIGK